MSSPAQVAANQANAKLSTGPTSEAGKYAVGKNSLKHALTGSTHAALPGEEEALERHCEGYRKAYAPAGFPEHDLVRNIAENYWRLKRAHAMETALFRQIESEQSDELDRALAHAQAWIDPVKGLQRIALYSNRIERAIEKSTAELKSTQAERKAAYAAAQEAAILLTQLAGLKGQTIDPAIDFPTPELAGGFAYSAADIARILNRAARLEEARARFAPMAQAS